MPKNPQEVNLQQILGQHSVTVARTSVVSPSGASSTIVVTKLICTNHSDTDAWVSIYVSDSGSTFDDTNVIASQVRIPPRSIFDPTTITGDIVLSKETSNLGISANTADRITATVFGYEQIVHDGN